MQNMLSFFVLSPPCDWEQETFEKRVICGIVIYQVPMYMARCRVAKFEYLNIWTLEHLNILKTEWYAALLCIRSQWICAAGRVVKFTNFTMSKYFNWSKYTFDTQEQTFLILWDLSQVNLWNLRHFAALAGWTPLFCTFRAFFAKVEDKLSSSNNHCNQNLGRGRKYLTST